MIPFWLTLLLALISALGLVGLCFSIGGLLRLANPTANFFQFPATQTEFRFRLTKPGRYDLRCTRAGRWGNGFDVPDLTLQLRAWPAGEPAQLIQTSSRNFIRRADMSGATTLTIGRFGAPAAGEYQLLNPDGGQFRPDDRLSIQQPSGSESILLILAVIASAIMTLGGFIGGLIGWLDWLKRAA